MTRRGVSEVFNTDNGGDSEPNLNFPVIKTLPFSQDVVEIDVEGFNMDNKEKDLWHAVIAG